MNEYVSGENAAPITIPGTAASKMGKVIVYARTTFAVTVNAMAPKEMLMSKILAA